MKSILISVMMATILVIGFYLGKSYYLKPRLENGEKAAGIQEFLSDSSAFALSKLNGRYVLLDFWGSWCRPCREANPDMVRLYKEFHNESFKDASGFDIVSFGIERSRERWLEAIKADSLYWPYHLVSTKLFDDPVVKAYNIKQIPTQFLIDPNGIIIAIDPSLAGISRLLKVRIKDIKPK